MAAEFAEFDAGGLRWRAETPHADVVRRDVAERLVALERAPGVEVVKKNLVRTVLRVTLSTGQRVIVKRYAVRGTTDLVKYALVPSRAMAEWTAGRGLAEAGVPTVVPIAMAERREAGLRDAALVVPEVPDALHLNAYVEQRIAPRHDADALRTRLYDDLVAVIRKMHDAGFVHRDLHGGNVLVNGPPESPRIWLIDLHSVRGPGKPSNAAKRTDVVKLLHSMLTCSTPEERSHMYLSWGRVNAPGTGYVCGMGISLAVERLEADLAAMETRRGESRTARALTRSSRFDISDRGGFRVHHLRTIPADALVRLIGAHRATLASGNGEVLKDSERSALTRQELDGRSVIVKEYRSAGAVERLKNAARRPRAVAAWLAGNGLLVRRFDAAEPLALVLRGRGVALREAYLVMEDLGEDARVDLVALGRYAGDLDAAARREKRDLVLAIARLFRSLHASGVYHGDLKAVNLFVREKGREPRIVLADYDRVEFDRALPRRRRIKNLAQLSASVAVCISLTDRLRFFREYASDDPGRAAAWKKWFRLVILECRRKIVVRMKPIE